MSDSSEHPVLTPADLRALDLALADRCQQLQAALTIEIREAGALSAAESRADAEHLAAVALAELRIARHDLAQRAHDPDPAPSWRQDRLDRRLTMLVVATGLLTTIANAAVVLSA